MAPFAKLALLAAALGLTSGTAQANPICMPDVAGFQRSATFSGFQDWGSGYLVSQQYSDYPSGNHRIQDVIDQDTGEETYVDVLINVTANAVWRAEGKKGSGIYKCTKSSINFRIPAPCLLQNATRQGDVTVGGSLDVVIYNEAGGDGGANKWHAQLLMTSSLNIPVSVREVQEANGQVRTLNELFYNFNANLPGDAFRLNPICQAAEAAAAEAAMDAQAFAAQFPRHAHQLRLTRL